MAETEYNTTRKLRRTGWIKTVALGTGACFGLYLLSGHNYLLFHTLVELWAVAVAWGVFLLIWNARRLNPPPALVMLGLGYLLVGGMDLLHTLSYEGMGVFAETGPDLATQMWMAARFIETAVLLLFPLSLSSARLARDSMIGLTISACILTAMILVWDHFPVCFDPDTGLTGFKTAGEYIIMTFLIGAGVLTIHQRRQIGTRVAPLMAAAIFVTVASEFMFTRYTSPFGVSNMLGHLLKVVSFLLIYRALIVEGLEYPFEILNRALVKREQILGAVSEVAGRLLEQSVWDGVETALQKIGESAEVQRAYIFENHTGPDGRLLTSQRYEWSHDGVTPQKTNPLLVDIPYEEAGFKDWIDVLSNGPVIASPVSRLPEKQSAFLDGQQIQSLAVVPVFADGAWWGFMGFDDCTAPRQWHVSELDALQAAARIFGAFVTRMHYLEALTTVSAREKHRLSRELHDGLCQDLKGLELQATLLEDGLPLQYEPARQMAASLGQAANLAVKKAYAIVQGMFSVDLDVTDFRSALEQLAEKMQPSAGIRITTSLDRSLIPPSRLHAYHLYRIAQEALVNAVRHSGAEKIELTWERENRYMLLMVTDNGRGLDSGTRGSETGLGLQVMASRAQAINARFMIRKGQEAGTQVLVRLTHG